MEKNSNYGPAWHKILELEASPGLKAAPAIKFSFPSSAIHTLTIQATLSFQFFSPSSSAFATFSGSVQGRESYWTDMVTVGPGGKKLLN